MFNVCLFCSYLVHTRPAFQSKTSAVPWLALRQTASGLPCDWPIQILYNGWSIIWSCSPGHLSVSYQRNMMTDSVSQCICFTVSGGMWVRTGTGLAATPKRSPPDCHQSSWPHSVHYWFLYHPGFLRITQQDLSIILIVWLCRGVIEPYSKTWKSYRLPLANYRSLTRCLDAWQGGL